LLSGFTINHPSDRGIPKRELSKLKRIETYLRSLIQQYRLNSLAILSIESEISRGLNLDKIVKVIASAKIRKIGFSLQMHVYIVGYNSLKQGCEAVT